MKRFRTGLAAAALSLGLTGPAFGQFTNWNGSGTDWGTAGSWTNGVPTSTTTAQFLPSVPSFGFASAQPSITGPQTALGLTIAPSPTFGGWTFTGNGELTLGGSGSTGLTTLGPATYTFNGPTLTGASSTNTLFLNVGSGSTLTLAGNSAVTNNAGSISVLGGRLVLDNSGTNRLDRLPNSATASLFVNGGGSVFELIGNSAGTATSLGSLDRADNTFGGTNRIRVTPNGAATSVTFANSGTFSLRGGTRSVLRFEAASGALGDTNGAQIKFAGTPHMGTAGLLANSSGGGTVGFGVVADSFGVNYATYNGTGTGGLGIVSIANPASGVAITTLTDTLSGSSSTGNNQLNISAGTTVSNGAVTLGSLRISPAAGATLNLTGNLGTAAIMVDGANDFSITGTGTLGTGTHYFYVNNPNTTVSITNPITSGSNPAVFAGPGTIALTGTGLQNNGTAGNNYRLTIAEGVLRAGETQMEFSGTRGVINLFGGVLEITGGTSGTGGSADFRRPLGTTGGGVNWGGGLADRGSGGFSAFGNPASVSIGGATPTTLQWNATNFVGTGFALTFGSTRSNAVLTFQNPIRLDNESSFQLREIRVTAGTGGDRTVLAGAITGTANSDLLKTGTGVLELAANNSGFVAGNTLVTGGTLLATNATSSTGTGNVVVGGMATLAGTGTLTPTGGNAVTVLPGGLLVPGTPVAAGSDTPGTLTVLGPVNLTSGSALRAQLNGTTAGSGYGQIAVNGLSLGGAALQLFTGGGFNPASGDRLVLVSNTGGTDGTTFGGLAQNGTGTTTDGGFNFQISYTGNTAGELTGGNSVVLYNFAPVPEPGAVLALAAGGLGLLRLRLRRV